MKKPKVTQTSYGWHSMPDEYYFSLPYLSNSGLKLLGLTPSHLKAALDREQLKAQGKADPEQPTPAMIFGAAFHHYHLGFSNKIAVTPTGIDRRTKQGKLDWFEFLGDSKDKTVISPEDFEKIKAMHASVKAHPKASKLIALKDTLREASGLWEHPIYGYQCKIKTDLVSHPYSWITDLKTTICAHPDEFNRAIYNFKYHWQAYWYTKGAKTLTGKDYKFLIIAVEKSEPYAVAVYEIGRTWLEIAKREVEPLEALYADCLNSGDWYGYNQSIIISNPPAWAAKK